MDFWQVVCLCAVLLLALYGCAQLMIRMSRMLLRPHKPTVSLLLVLEDRPDLEQQIRYAHWLSTEYGIPLQTKGTPKEEQSRMVAKKLLAEISVS